MLPNHSSLVVAEQFGMLEALHPGRIDLGIGRAPGTDQATAQALHPRASEGRGPDDFPRQLTDLLGFFTGSWPENHPYRQVHAVPGEGNGPDLWLLGSSGYSAQVAGALACRSHSRTTSCRTTRCPPLTCTAARSARRRR